MQDELEWPGPRAPIPPRAGRTREAAYGDLVSSFQQLNERLIAEQAFERRQRLERLPEAACVADQPMEVPVAQYLSDLCGLGGVTVPFDDALLRRLYPTHADYFCKMQAATRRSVEAGFLLAEDGEELMARAAAARNRWPAPFFWWRQEPARDCSQANGEK